MFAVIKTGGKQYRVAKDDVIVVEKLEGKAGGKITFVRRPDDAATARRVKLGKDLAGITVTGTLVETKKGDKVTVFKKRRRNTYRRKIGHRQAESHVQDHRHRRQEQTRNKRASWLTKKQAVALATVVTRRASALA